MRILALDASTEALSVALLDTAWSQNTIEHFEIAPQAHARRLLPVAQQLLDEAGWRLTQIDGFAFGRGPGAFTGLRIAAGLIQGLASGLDRPVAGISTLAAIAARGFDQAHGVRAQIVQDARMGEIYTARYRRGRRGPEAAEAERVMAPAALELDTRADTIRAGNGWHLVTPVSGHAEAPVIVEAPHAADIARLSESVFAAGEAGTAESAVPVYVRDEVARKPAAG